MKPQYFKIIVAVTSLLLGTSRLNSQNAEANTVNKLTTEQGLASNLIYSIVQDNNGFIWIATDRGLNRFDGRNLTLFAPNKGRYSLSHNRTQCMIQVENGNIWSGTSDGLNIYDVRTDSIIKVRDNTNPLKLKYNDITVLAPSEDKSKVWIGTYGNGVNYFDWSANDFFVLTLPKLPNVAAPLNVVSLLEDENKRLWIGTQENGLYRFEAKDKTLRHYPMQRNGKHIRTIFEDSHRRIWVGTSKGCCIYNETSDRFEQVSFPQGLVENSIGAIIEDRNGRLWIGTELFLLSFEARSFSLTEKFDYQVYEHGESQFRLSCPSVNAIYADAENNIWVGTAWGGVNMLKGSPSKFKLYKHDSGSENSLPNSPISTICDNGNNSLIIGTMGTSDIGLCQMDLLDGSVKELPVNVKLKGYVYQALHLDSNDKLWVATYNKGLLVVDKTFTGYKEFLFDDKNPNSLPNNDVRAIYEGQDQIVWIGTSDGLVKIDKRDFSVTRCNVFGKRKIAVRTIKEGPAGRLWLGTYGDGVVSYDYQRNHVDFGPTKLNFHIVTDILIQSDSVWIATQGEGLFLYNQKTSNSTVYTEENGLSSNYLSSILHDKAGNIWIGNSKGIDKLAPKTSEIEKFNSGDGLQSGELMERSAVELPNGTMVFAGFAGINVFDPNNVAKDVKSPPVKFTKLTVFNEPIAPSDRYKILKENITLADKIELKHNHSVFTLEFMGINYNANEKLQYAYLLEGAEKEWNLLGNQNSITFRNLKPGEYVLKVKASSPDAVWSGSNIASLAIVVRPPFWATGWAYLIYMLFLGSVVYFIWLMINIRIQAINRLRMERTAREKDEELHQEKLQFFTNISHEFRTPLTLILAPLELMLQEERNDERKTSFKLMIKNANRLLSMVNQLLDFRKAERGQMKLKVQEANVVDAVKEIMGAFETLSTQKNIQLDFVPSQHVIESWIDIEFLNKALMNLLANAFKFTPKGGRIVVSATITKTDLGKNLLVLAITDNGMGVKQEDIPHIFNRFYQGPEKNSHNQGSGIGLHLVKTLVEMHHGTIEVDSIPNVKTTFTVTLPMDKDVYRKDEFGNEPDKTQQPLNDLSTTLDSNNPLFADHSAKTKSDNRPRLLVVEDNEEIRAYVRSILEPKYLVDEAENGAVGLEMVKEKEFDLVISDLMMPELDGIEMCRQIKESIETSHIPIVMLTAKSEIQNRIEGLSVGADSYITKPFHPQHLLVRVDKLIELRTKLKEVYSRKISFGEISPEVRSESPDELFLQKAIAVIADKMVESEFNGDKLAIELGVSRMGLHRKIKALTGQSTGELIRNIRLNKACELLRSHAKNVSEVCYEVGFNSPSYFTSCFTEVYKMPPSEYAKANKPNIPEY